MLDFTLDQDEDLGNGNDGFVLAHPAQSVALYSLPVQLMRIRQQPLVINQGVAAVFF